MTSLNQLVFTPAANFSGNATLAFQVQDDGGTAERRRRYRPDPQHADVQHRSGQRLGRPARARRSTRCSTTRWPKIRAYTLKPADFGFSDTLDNPPNAFQAVVMVSVPVSGTLFNNGSPIRPAWRFK